MAASQHFDDVELQEKEKFSLCSIVQAARARSSRSSSYVDRMHALNIGVELHLFTELTD